MIGHCSNFSWVDSLTDLWSINPPVNQGDQKILKNCQIFQKIAQKVKTGQHIYNKAQFESQRHLQQTTFELKYLQQTMLWNWLFRWKFNKFALTKSSPKSRHYFGLIILTKNHNEPPKVAQLAKNRPIHFWSNMAVINQNPPHLNSSQKVL